MKEGFFVNGSHSYGTFGLRILQRNIGESQKDNYTERVPFSSVVHDFSRIYGEPTYGERTISYTLEFICLDKKAAQEKILMFIENMKWSGYKKLYDDLTPDYCYKAREPAINWSENHGVYTLECSETVELAKNIKSLDVKTDSTNIITRLIPLGAQLESGESAERLTIESVNGGIPYIDDEAAIEKYGIIVGTAEFDDITLPENLIKSGREYLKNNNRIRRAYEAQVLDLSVLDKSKQSIRCGNTYPFKHKIFAVNENLRVMKRTVDIYKPYSPTIQIGDKTEKITDIATRTAQLIEYELPKQKIDILTAAKATASALIKSGFKGHVVANDEEVCIMDTPDKSTATKVWRWTMGGFGYSNNGYDGDYETAITMDGAIVADFITAGVLRGLEIINGDGTFHVLPDGTVIASAIQIKGGSVNIQANSNENENIISLAYGNYHGSFAPFSLTYFNVGSGKTRLYADGIFGWSDHQNPDSQTFAIQSATGNFHTAGNVYANDLYFSRDGVSTSVNGTVTAINSEFESIRGQIQTIFEMLDFITGGAG